MKVRAKKLCGILCAVVMVMGVSGCQSIFPDMGNGQLQGGELSGEGQSDANGDITIEKKLIETLDTESSVVSVSIDETEQIEVTFTKSEDAVYRLQYSSSDESICTVTPDGTVQGIAAGKATVFVEDIFSGLKAKVLVLVHETCSAESIRLSVEELVISVDESVGITATVLPQEAEDKEVTWKSSDESIATVNSEGEVTGVAKGKCVITATLKADTSILAEVAVEVTEDKRAADVNGTDDNNAGNNANNNGSNSGSSNNSGNNANANNGNNSNSGSSNSNSANNNSNNNNNSGNSSSGGSTAGTTAATTEEATTETQAAYYMDGYAEQVLSIVNARRAEAGLAPLSMNYTLVSAAKVRAGEITQSFSHTRPNGSSCFTAFNEAGVGYSGAGENIAAGQWTPDGVMNSWMNSEGHRANIMNGDFTQIGIACYYDPNSPYGYYWVQCFIY